MTEPKPPPGAASLLDSPPVWLALCILLAWAQSRLLPLVDAGRAGDRAGLVLILAGLALMAASVLRFVQARTTIVPRQQARALITGGVYRLSRNPIYLADALILTGFVLRWDLASLPLVPAFVWLIQTRFILGEEAGLRAAFGPAFEAFAARTRRWL